MRDSTDRGTRGHRIKKSTFNFSKQPYIFQQYCRSCTYAWETRLLLIEAFGIYELHDGNYQRGDGQGSMAGVFAEFDG
jgi:hypothetical protein